MGALDELIAESGIDPSVAAFLDGTSDHDAAALLEAFRASRRDHEQQLRAAIDHGLRMLPAPLRARVKKMLRGRRA